MAITTQVEAIYLDYPTFSSKYSIVQVDWRCDTLANGTFWATHVWNNGSAGGNGYAGFQVRDDKNITIFSMWSSEDGVRPNIEYLSSFSDRENLVFGNEGAGIRLISQYKWEENIWYTMYIGVHHSGGKTYYAQWIGKTGSDEKNLIAVMSVPVKNQTIPLTNFFQEDFETKKYLKRGCSVKCKYGYDYSESKWKSWNKLTLQSAYNDSTSGTVLNDPQNCNYKIGSINNVQYISIEAGFGVNSGDLKLPKEDITLSQPNSPSQQAPTWASLPPKYIQNYNSKLYVVPTSNNKVLQDSNKYYWNFVDSNDGYVFILNSDGSKAITLSGTVQGSELIMSPFNSGDKQKWKIVTDAENTKDPTIYFIPKSSPNQNMEVRNASYISGAVIQIWDHATTPPQFKWYAYNEVSRCSIKNFNSNYFINPGKNDLKNKVVQNLNEYEWNIVECGNEEFYILTPDNSKAVSLDEAIDGSDLILKDFSPLDSKQKWKKSTISSADSLFYIIPVTATSMKVEVENASTGINGIVQVWSSSASSNPQFKWYITYKLNT